MKAALDYELGETQKLRNPHNLFEDDSRRFYRSYVQSICTTFEEACINMQTEHSNISRQNRVKKYLRNILLAPIMKKKSCNASEAVKELREVITKFAPQGPRAHRSEGNKVKYRYGATIGTKWA